MKQGLKKALVMLLSVAMVFTFMAMPVYADDLAEAEPEEVILDASEAEAVPADEEAEQIAEPEAVQEDASEIAAEDPEPVRGDGDEPSAETVVLADGTYNATGLKTAVLSMYHFVNPQVVVKGDKAWLITTEEKGNTVKRFDGMAYGPQSQILDETDETHRTLVEGTVTATVVPVYDEDGALQTRTFVLPVPKSVLEANGDIYYMVKYVEGYSDKHDGDWYKAEGGDYYLTGYTLEWVNDSTVLPGEEPAVEPIELEITNNTSMFKAVTATALSNADGSAALTFALSGSGYHWLYKGTYEEALAANEAIAAGIAAGKGSDKLIKGYTNADGKWEFQMNIGSDELGKEVPVVAISDSYYEKYVNGQNPLERAYYPRQFNLNMEAKTLVTGDFDMNYEFTLTTALDDFKAVSPVSVHIVGGPNSNNYKVEPTLVMNDTTYDKVTFPSTADPKEATLTEGKFAISMVNQPNNAAFKDKTPLTFTFHVAETAPYEEAGSDVVRTVTFNQVARTITVEGTPLTPKEEPGPSYEAGQYIVGVKSIKLVGGADYTMFIPTYQGKQNKALVTVDEQGNAVISFTTEKKTYKAIILAELESGSTAGCLNQLPTEEQMASEAYINATTNAENSGYRDFEFTFNTADLGKTVPYVTVSNSSGKFNATQLAFVFDETMTPKAVYDVISMIDALPAAADVTVRDKDAIEAARAAYDALTADQKAQVTNLSKLVAAEEAFAALPEKDEATIAVEEAMGKLIQQYIDVNETTAAAVADVRSAYNALSAQQKAYIDDSVLFKLYRAEACVAFVNEDGIALGEVYDTAIDTSDDSPFIAATAETGRQNAVYIYLYSVADKYNNASLVSGTVSKSTTKTFGNGSGFRTLWMVQSSEGQGRTFVIKLTGPNGESENYTVKAPGVYGVMDEGTYDVAAIQTPSSAMRKFERSTITSNGESMTVEFVMPNTSYGKIFLGTKEEAGAATEGFIEPTGTEPTSGTTGTGNVYSIPLEAMYMPITISYFSTSKKTWTQETIEFVADDQAQAVIDAIAALNLNTYFNVTADQRAQVEAANELYKALNDNQKAILDNSNYSTLKRVVAMFEVADIVADEIEKLPAVENITKDDIDEIRKVKEDFDGMGKSDIIMAVIPQGLQNSQIEKLISKELKDKLNAAVAKADELDVEVERIFGSTRYETSLRVAEELKKRLGVEKFDAVVVTNGGFYPDALSGSYLTCTLKAPVLLMDTSKERISAIQDYIKENLKEGGTVYLLGGTAVVPDSVMTGLDGFKPERLGGATRYETNIEIIKATAALSGKDIKELIVCSGNGFADSLSAAATGKPIMILNTTLQDSQKEFLETLKGNGLKITVVGGTGVISDALVDSLKAYGEIEERVWGQTRYETSAKVAEKFFSKTKNGIVACGVNFPDGLCGGVLANTIGGPMVLAAIGTTDYAKDYADKSGMKSGIVLGGPALITDSDAEAIFGTAIEN